MTVSRETETAKCSRCRTNPQRDGQRYCVECHRIYQREWSRQQTKRRKAHRKILGEITKLVDTLEVVSK